MKPTIKTDASLRSIRVDPARQVEYPDEKQPGLALRVSPAGSKQWSLRYRTKDGKQRRINLGAYPTVSLSDARSKARIVMGAVEDGGDPADERRKAKAAAKVARDQTVAGLLTRYLEEAGKGQHKPNGRPKRASTIDLERYYLNRFIQPRLGRLAISELTRGDVQGFLNDIAGSSGASSARHCRNLLRQALNVAVRREQVARNPAAFVEVTAPAARERVLTDDELRAIWQAAGEPLSVKELDLSPGLGLAIQFAMLTLQRAGEVTGIHASEVDFDSGAWAIPGERTKNHRLHVVPLSEPAKSLLERAYGLAEDRKGFAFPSPRDEGRKPITRAALTRGVARITAALKIKDARPHDFRRTGATAITSERIGIPRFIVSRVLNQISDHGGAAQVTAVYDRNEYLPEKRRALDAWAVLLAEIVAGKKRSGNVVNLRG